MRHARILKSKAFIILMIFTMIFLSGFYIFQVNAEISDRYLIDSYAKKASEFSKQNKILEITLAREGSLGGLTSELAAMSFVKIDKISYIKVLSSQAVAK
jgi:hypothetical protein